MSSPTFCHLCGGQSTSKPAPPIAIGNEVFRNHCGLARCSQCKVRFVDPRPTHGELSTFYNTDGYDCHNPMFSSDPDIRLEIIERFIRPGSLCDFGAGAGRLLESARARGWTVCGVEPGRSRAQLERQGFNVQEDIAKIEPVDAISMIHVLEHCPSPGEVLSSLRKKLRPEGIVYIEVPNADSLRARLADSFLKPLWTHAPERYLAFPIHLFYFNTFSLTRLLKSSGYRIVEIGTMGMGVEELFTPSPPASPVSSQSPAVETTPSASFKPVKKAIKSVMFNLHLGENLYIIASAESA
jgi:SAM-dependent methyltransferase